MSETAIQQAEIKQQNKEPLFSKKNRKLITDPLNDSNPITVQVLGICSALAVTVQVKNAFVMALSVTAVTILGNVIMSLMRNAVPNRIRIIVQLVVVATLVILVDQILKAFVYDVSKQLSVFVGLIITNCIIMGRIEAFALGNKPGPAMLDGLGNGLGYGIILIVVAFFREIFGSGKLWGYEILGKKAEATGLYSIGYVDNNFMILPPMALVIVGIYIWVQRSRNTKLIEKE
jgi:Na+-transporting NADH:ubiquinone oxidoreductase subunit D